MLGDGQMSWVKNENRRWKLNTAILEEEEYQTKIRNFLTAARKHQLHVNDMVSWWEKIVKPGIKKISIDYSVKRTEIIRQTTAFYQQCLQDVISGQSFSEDEWTEYRNLQKSSKRWEEEKQRGLAVRSRCDSELGDESATTYHIAKERRRGAGSSIQRLKNKDGDTIEGTDDIKRLIEEHFRKQYETVILPTENDLATSFLSGVVDKASFNRDELIKEISQEEVHQVLKSKKKNKSPGVDGLPYEFYSMFWSEIGPMLTNVMNKTLIEDKITGSQGQAIIRLIPKKPRPNEITDYRPISLLCTDYKLLAAVLSNRLSKTLANTISLMQKGGIPGRKIDESLITFRDVIKTMTDRQGKGALIGIDLARAYDLVRRDVVWTIMNAMGYPEEFISWIRCLYSVTSMRFDFGAGITDSIQGAISLRQGCPMSMLLFIIYIEPLLTKIESNLVGIPTPGGRVRSRAFVDDITVFIGSQQDLNTCGEILSNFTNWSGAVVNPTKTQILGLGSWSNRIEWGIEWAKPASSVRLLGIPYEASIESTISNCWKSVVSKMMSCLRENIGRDLTIQQRVKFIKESAISTCVFAAKVLPCPTVTVEQMTSQIKRFVWFGKREKTPEGVLWQRETGGGIGLPHLSSFFRSLFLKSNLAILRNDEGPAGKMLQFWTAFPLRKIFQFYRNEVKPYAVVDYPDYLKPMVQDIKRLVDDGIICNETTQVNHKMVYTILSEEALTPGKLELKLPFLEWTHVWKQASLLPADLKEQMFMINHDILPTRERLKRMDPKADDKCQNCKTETETLSHLFFKCPLREYVVSKIKFEIKNLGYDKTEDEILHLSFEPTENGRKASRVAASYMFTLWKCRQERRTLAWRDVLLKAEASSPPKQKQ